jgi:hypothetical protein
VLRATSRLPPCVKRIFCTPENNVLLLFLFAPNVCLVAGVCLVWLKSGVVLRRRIRYSHKAEQQPSRVLQVSRSRHCQS